MKFGVQNLFPAEGDDDHRVLLDTLEEIRLADELGFDSAWLAEHHFSRYGILGSPLLLAAAIAQQTKRIRIGTAVVVLPFHNPLRLAEDAAAIDVLSGGRLDLGVGRGYQPGEFKGFGIAAETSKQRYKEIVDILELAWNEPERFSYEGEHYSVDDVAISPRPVQPGGPPILHAVVSPASFPERGSLGHRIITSPTFSPLGLVKRNFDAYREALVEAGHDPADFDIPFMQQTWVGDPAKLPQVAEAALTYYKTVGQILPGSQEAISSEVAYYEKVRHHIDLLTIEQALTHGGNFGSVDQVVDTLGRLATELGVTHYICWFRIPSLDRNVALEAMETFATEVIPQLRDVEPITAAASVGA